MDEDLNTTERQVDELRKNHGTSLDPQWTPCRRRAGLDAALELMRDARECIARILGILQIVIDGKYLFEFLHRKIDLMEERGKKNANNTGPPSRGTIR